MKLSSEYKIQLGFGAAFFLLLITFTYLVFTTSQLLYHLRMVNQTSRVVHYLELLSVEEKNLLSTFDNKMPVDSSFTSGYYLQNFRDVDSICELVRKDIRREFIPNVRLREIRNTNKELHDLFAKQTQSDSKDHTLQPVKGDSIKMKVFFLQSKIEDMIAPQKALLSLRSAELNNSSSFITWINIVIIIISLILAGYSLMIYNRENQAKQKANRMVVDYIQTLEKNMTELKNTNSELSKLRSLQKYTATGRIARMIAHEVRNPLTNINLSSEQLKEIIPEEKTSSLLLSTILRNSKRIDHLVGELLNATQLQDLSFTKISINELLNETLELALDRIQIKHIQVIKQYAPDICEVEADHERIKIAFLNIMINAIESMPAENGILSIKTENPAEQCIVTITDNGSGIERESLDKIFDPFFTTKEKGTGMGLANVQSIILSHKGNIEVESEPGKGTSFIVTLNLSKNSR